MRIAPFIAVALTVLSFASHARAQTQAEMNEEAAAEFRKADEGLNAAYRKLRFALDDSSQARLKEAQKAWLAYRDAEAGLEAAPSEGGSIYPSIFAGVKARLTDARTKELRAILASLKDPETR